MEALRTADDILLVKELLGFSTADLARETGIGSATFARLLSGEANASTRTLEGFYNYAFNAGLRLTAIKSQLNMELIEADGRICLFHGSKSGLEGAPRLERSRQSNDFGQGFYCGENLEQAATFVAGYPSPSLYIVSFDPTGLTRESYHVDREWMLTIAFFRGRLGGFAEHPLIQSLSKRVENSDYVVAPIADNRMFELIDTFIDGEITDIQCQHCLSATNLGYQYVFTSAAALEHVEIVERCYLSSSEKRHYLEKRREEAHIGADKVRAARRQFRGQGLYIEELF